MSFSLKDYKEGKYQAEKTSSEAPFDTALYEVDIEWQNEHAGKDLEAEGYVNVAPSVEEIQKMLPPDMKVNASTPVIVQEPEVTITHSLGVGLKAIDPLRVTSAKKRIVGSSTLGDDCALHAPPAPLGGETTRSGKLSGVGSMTEMSERRRRRAMTSLEDLEKEVTRIPSADDSSLCLLKADGILEQKAKKDGIETITSGAKKKGSSTVVGAAYPTNKIVELLVNFEQLKAADDAATTTLGALAETRVVPSRGGAAFATGAPAQKAQNRMGHVSTRYKTTIAFPVSR